MSPRPIIICLLAALCTGCSMQKKQPTVDLSRIYGGAARSHRSEVNPVIVIPGILGSKLVDPVSKKSVWGMFDNNFLDPADPQNLPLVALPLHGENRRARAVANGALTSLRFRVLGVPVQQRAYAGILSTLGVGGFLDEDLASPQVDWGKNHFTCFQFSYDWRLSNAENAEALHRFILEKRRYIRQRSRELYGTDRPDLKFDIVAHSMGGLLARYYLRYGTQALPSNGSLPRLNWAGAKHVDQLVMIGTPNSGSILAFNELQDGKKFLPDWQRTLLSVNLPKFSPAILATFPSLYELLPRTRHQALLNLADDKPLDLFDPKLWENHQWGILHPSQKENLAALLPNKSPSEQQKFAKAHLRHRLKKAHQFQRSLDRPAKPPKHLRLSLIAGDAIATPRQIKIDLATGKRTDNDYTPGDGLVLRSSTLADERLSSPKKISPRLQSPISFHRVIFLPEEHLALTNSATFTDNLLYQLLMEPKH